ncbi:MAG: AraC family ligand binding domain-containing protein, partial [Clostridia bacterium]|nr:AraC family ligand binding domain-containing protein [Clostridia bacterium]
MPFTVTDHVYPTFFSPGVKSNHSFSVSDRCLLSDAKIQALHYHSGIELGICLSGQGKTVIQNRVYAYRAGDFSLIMPRCPHLSASAPGTVSRWLWLSFSPDFLKQTGMELSSLYPLWQKRGSSGSFSPAECPLLFKDVTEIAQAAKRAVAAGEPKDSAA